MSAVAKPAARLLLTTLAALLLPVAAEAHAHLRSASPPPDGIATPRVSELDLTFSEGVSLAFTGAALLGPDGRPVPTGPARLGAAGSSLVVPLPTPLAPGSYTVDWHALAVDGHKTSGRYGFSVRP